MEIISKSLSASAVQDSRLSNQAASKLFQNNVSFLKTLWSILALDPDNGFIVRLHLSLKLLQLLQLDQLVHHPPPPAPHEQVGEEDEEEPDNAADNDSDGEAWMEEADTAPYEEGEVECEGEEEGGQGLLGVDAVGEADRHVHRAHE